MSLTSIAESTQNVSCESPYLGNAGYMVGVALDHLNEDSGGAAAILLSEVIRRRCEALERLAEQREG